MTTDESFNMGSPLEIAQRILRDMDCDRVEQHRAEFEQLAYRHYLDRKVAGKLDPTAEGDGTPEALFWKQEDGSYGVLMFNAAWQGFKWGRGLV